MLFAWHTRRLTVTKTTTQCARLLLASVLAFSVHAVAQQPQAKKGNTTTITFYEQEGFAGRWFSTGKRIGDFKRFGFNDLASSIKVRGGRWEVCTAPRFEGRCAVLRRGDYSSLRDTGLEDRISSARPLQRGNRQWERREAYDANQVPDRR